MPEARTDRVRMVALNYRKPGMSEEDFHSYWSGQHFKAFSSMAIARKNLLKYEQCHRNAEQVKTFIAAGFPVPDFDGLAIFEAESYDKIIEVFTSEEYKKNAIPDEEKFLDRSKIICFPADLVTVIDK